MNRKKGVSGLIVTVVMIALVLVLVGLIWSTINSLVRGQVRSTQSCFGNYGKISLNAQYTCWDNVNSVLQFSINLADINVDSLVVSISSVAGGKSFYINVTESTIANLANYGSDGFGTDLIKLPGRNEGKTYLTNYATTKPDYITIAPIINKQQCEVSDIIRTIENCL